MERFDPANAADVERVDPRGVFPDVGTLVREACEEEGKPDYFAVERVLMAAIRVPAREVEG